jgi:hypothetical protein
MISSLSLAQSPSKPGTATVQKHRFQWLQLPPASSRQDPGPKISWRRAGALAEPGSPSPPAITGAMGRAGRDRDRQRPAGQPRKHRVDQRPPGLTTAARPRTAPLGRRHRDEGTGSLAHHRPPGKPQPRPGQVRQLHPGALLRPAALPEALLAAALVGLQHRGGLGPTADRRVAGQPDQLQQPPQRSGDVQLASDPSATCAAARATGTPAARAG